MQNDEVLGHLLEIESEAAALVDDAQAEADRRITEAEKQNRIAYEERYRAENNRLESELRSTKERAQQQYQKELESYKIKIAAVSADTDRFSDLLSNFLLNSLTEGKN